MTKMSYTGLVGRSYALRFDPTTPDAVIEATVREANELLTAQVPGLIFFPFEWKNEVFSGHAVKSVRLHADDSAWERFRSRGISMLPVLARRVDLAVARRRSPAQLGSAPTALAS